MEADVRPCKSGWQKVDASGSCKEAIGPWGSLVVDVREGLKVWGRWFSFKEERSKSRRWERFGLLMTSGAQELAGINISST